MLHQNLLFKVQRSSTQVSVTLFMDVRRWFPVLSVREVVQAQEEPEPTLEVRVPSEHLLQVPALPSRD